MTTTANLSVGIDTTPALTSLKALRAEMSGAGLNILVKFDSKTIDEEISRYFKQRKFSVGMSNTSLQNLGKDIQGYVTSAIDGAFEKSSRTLGWNQAALRGGMNSVFNEVFKDNERRLHWDRDRLHKDLTEAIQAATHLEHRVGINSLALTKQVQAAVDAGMVGTTVRAAGAAVPLRAAGALGEGGVSPKLAEGIKNMLTPAIDELSKAAMALAAVAKKTGLVRDAGSGTASIGNSFKDPVLGTIKTSVPADFVTASSQIMVGNDQKAVFARKNFENTLNLRQAEKEAAAQFAGDVLKASEEYKLGVKARKEAFALADKEMAAQSVGDALKASEEYKLGLKARREAFALAEKQMAAQASGDALKASEEYKLGLKARREAFALAEKDMAAQSLGDAANAQGQYQTALAARRAALTTAEREHIAALRNVGASAATVARREGFTNEGVRVASAKAMVNLDPVIGAKLTGNDEILRMIPQLDTLKKAHAGAGLAAHESSEAHKRLNTVMNDGHIAAKGLAGSMGALWTTYSSIAPLLAAAAIGTALHSVFKVGKDVEYQLAFVSALSDNAAVSMDKFNAAINGSLVGPVKAAEAMRGLAQNGLSVSESLRALPSILALATAGEMGLMEAALGATGVMSAFGLGVNDLGRVSDVFAKAAAISNTSVSGMVDSMRQASVVGEQFHIGLEEVAAAMAILGDRNIIGSQAGTSYRNMIQELYAPTKKATEAFKLMHLELYDGNNVLINSTEAIKKVRDVYLSLDQKSGILFLETVFNKKGDKAISAIVESFGKFEETLDILKNKTKGFADSIQQALGETTEGKLKKLMSEFEISTNKAFNSAGSSAKGFIDQLRLLVSSTGFEKTLQNIVNGVISLTRYLEENAKVIAYTIGIWVGFKVLDGVITMIYGLANAFKIGEVAAVSFGVASKAAIAWATGGTVILAALAFEFLTLSKNTTDADRALIDYTASLEKNNAGTASRIKSIQDENAVLERQVQLMWGGASAAKAKSDAEGEVVKNAANNAAGKLNRDKTALSTLEAQINSGELISPSADGGVDTSRVIAAERSAALLREAIKQGAVSVKEGIQLGYDTVVNDLRKRHLEVMTLADKFNDLLAQRKKVLPGITVTPVNIGWAAQAAGGKNLGKGVVTVQDVKDEIEAKTAVLNGTQLRSFKLPEKVGGPKHALDQAEKSDLISQLNSEEKEISQYIRFRKQLDDARYNPKLYGDAAVAAVAEQRQLTEISALMALQVQQIAKLKAARAALPGKYSKSTEKDTLDAELKRYDTEIARRSEAFRLAQSELRHEKEMQDIREENRERERGLTFDKTNSKLKVGDADDLRKLRESYSTKIESPAAAKGTEAARAAEAKWSSVILSQQEEVTLLEESRNILLLRRSELLGTNGGLLSNEVNALEAALEGNAQNLTAERARLTVREAMAKASGSSARQVGTDEFEKSQTAEYGLSKFWEKYKSEAESSAHAVEEIMKKSTDGMSQSFGNFVATGKGGFRSLVTSILSDLARVQANKIFAQLLGFAGNALGSYFGAKDYTLDSGGVSTNNTGDSLPTKGGAAGGTNFVERDMLTIIHHGEAVIPKAFNPSAGGALPQANVPQPEQRQAQPQAVQAPIFNMPITVVNNSGTPVKARTERDNDGGIRVVLDAVRSQLGGEIDNGAGLAHNMQSRFALNSGAGLMR